MSLEWDEQAEAGEVVRSHGGGRAQLRDLGGEPNSVHDLDVITNRGRVAVEVTRHVVDSELKARAEVQKRDWRFPSLGHHWIVKMAGSYRVKEMHSELVKHLRVLESIDVDVFWPAEASYTPIPPATRQALRALRVRYVCRLTEADEGGGKIVISDASPGGTTAPEVVVEVAEHHASLDDNGKKLEKARADERHLFIWIDGSKHQAVAAMSFDFLPDRAPSIPPTIDAVWLATAYRPATVWRYSRAAGWENLRTWSPAEAVA